MPVTIGSEKAYVYAGQYNPNVPLLPGGVLAPLPGRLVAVRRASDGQLAALFTNRAKDAAAANPVTIDDTGNLTWFAAPGSYTMHLILDGGVEGAGQLVVIGADPGDVLVAADLPDTSADLTNETAARIAADTAEANARAAADAAEAALARNADNLTSGTVADARIAATIARDSEVTAAVAAEAALARNADNLTSGTVADARIAATIARDSEVTSAVAAEATARDAAIATAIAGVSGGRTVVTFPKDGTLATGTIPRRYYLPRAGTISNVVATVNTAPSGQAVIVDLNRGSGEGVASSLYSTQANRPTIAAGNHSTQATLPDTVAVAQGDYLQVDIDQIGVSGSGTATFDSAQASHVAGDVVSTTHAITLPASGIDTGDLLIAIFALSGTSNPFGTGFGMSNGWSEYTAARIDNSANGISMCAFYKVAGADNSGTLTVSTGRSITCGVLCISGADLTATPPRDQVAVSNAGAATANTYTAPSVTPTGDGIVVVAWGAKIPAAGGAAHTATGAPGAGATERIDDCSARTTTTASNVALDVATIAASSGVAPGSTPRTVTWTPNSGAPGIVSAAITMNFKNATGSVGADLLVEVEYS